MNNVILRVMLAFLVAGVVSSAQAQVYPPPGAPQYSSAYSGGSYQPYPLPAPTPQDAYRDGLISRWELERIEGPRPQALQGPSVDSSRGGEGGRE